MLRLLLLCIINFVVIHSTPLKINLPSDGSFRCLTEDYIPKNTLFVFQVDAILPVSYQLSAVISTTHHSSVSNTPIVVLEETNISSTSKAFTTTVDKGSYKLCIKNATASSGKNTATIVIKWGSQARDYNLLAKKEHLDPITLELRKQEYALREYHDGILLLRDTQHLASMSHDNVNNGVLIMTVVSVVLMIVVSVVQILFFQYILRKKKII